MDQIKIFLAKFFGVAIKLQTYLNLIYLLLAFPLGLFYFIFLIVGLSVGIPLIIVWVGLLILPIVIAAWWLFCAFERQTAIWLLHVDIPPMTRGQTIEPGAWAQIKAHLSNPVTWKGLVYLLAKFPLGLLSFVICVVLIAVTAVFLAAPIIYPFADIRIWFAMRQAWQIDTLGEALVIFPFGLILAFISLHILNGLAWVSGQFARVMLGNPSSSQPAVTEPESAPISTALPTLPETPAIITEEASPVPEEPPASSEDNAPATPPAEVTPDRPAND